MTQEDKKGVGFSSDVFSKFIFATGQNEKMGEGV
jgi:hypothetical protein